MKKLLTYLLIASLAATAYAERLSVRTFSGLQTRSNIYEIKDNESPDMENFTLDQAGVLTKRDLFQQYNAASIGTLPITNLHKFYKSSDVGYLICSAGTNIYKASGGVLSDVCTATTVTTGSQWGFESFTDGTEELVFAANNGTRLLSWNGTDDNFIDREEAPAENCNLLKQHKSRLFAAGSTEYPYRLYYSSLTDGDDWSTSGGTLDLPSFEKIMALEVLADILYIFTKSSIYALNGDVPDEFYITLTRSIVGTHAAKSVALADKLIIFLNKAGVFAFDGDQAVNWSEPITPTINVISDTYIGDSAGLYDKRGRYWLAHTSLNGTYNDSILVYDTVLKQWYKLTGNFASLLKTEDGTDKGELYAGSADNIGFLWQLKASDISEQLVHSSKSQLQTGVTFNTVFMGSETFPEVELERRVITGDTKLLLDCDGTDGSLIFTDLSSQEHGDATVTADAEVNTSSKKYGTGSVQFDGDSGHISYADSSDWDIASSTIGDYTVDMWVKHDATPAGSEVYIGHDQSAAAYWRLLHTSGSGLNFILFSGSVILTTGSGGIIADTDWHHVALVKTGATYTLFLDGNKAAQVTDTSTLDLTGILYMGYGRAGYFEGSLDEIRITQANIFNYSQNLHQDYIDVPHYDSSGTLTSDNLQINSADQASLGIITWGESVEANTDIQLTTRTGTTADTTYDTWNEAWVSTSTVLMDVTDDTHKAWFHGAGMDIIIDSDDYDPLYRLQRDVTYYETYDAVTPNTVGVYVTGTTVTGSTIETLVSPTSVEAYKWLGIWLKSSVTGNAVKFDIGEVSGTSIGHITINTVTSDWEHHYWPLTGYASTDIDSLGWIKMTYLDDKNGSIYIGEIDAFDFYESGETITSTPNDFIQYRAVLGSTDAEITPQLINSNSVVVSLSYTSSAGAEETTLTSYFYTKPYDFATESLKFFEYVELTAESSLSPVTLGSLILPFSVYIDYSINDGVKTGTMSSSYSVTDTRVKLKFYFPSGSHGEEVQLKIYDNNVGSELKVHNMTMKYHLGGE